jgi:hypothetical protein
MFEKYQIKSKWEKLRFFEAAGPKYCSTCKATTPFHYSAFYVVRHIMLVARWTTGFEFRQVCSKCKYSQPADKAWVNSQSPDERNGSKHISLFDRFGWLLTLMLVAMLSANGYVQYLDRKNKEAIMVTTPKVGDLYIVSANRFLPTGSNHSAHKKGNFGLFRVAETRTGTVVFNVPNHFHYKVNQAEACVTKRNTMKGGYFGAQIDIHNIALEKMQKEGVIKRIYRMGE